MPTRNKLVFALTILLVALATALAAVLLTRGGSIGTGTALVGGPFTLTDQDGKREIAASLQETVDEQAPFVTHGFYPEYLAMQPDLRGVRGSSNSMTTSPRPTSS